MSTSEQQDEHIFGKLAFPWLTTEDRQQNTRKHLDRGKMNRVWIPGATGQKGELWDTSRDQRSCCRLGGRQPASCAQSWSCGSTRGSAHCKPCFWSNNDQTNIWDIYKHITLEKNVLYFIARIHNTLHHKDSALERSSYIFLFSVTHPPVSLRCISSSGF